MFFKRITATFYSNILYSNGRVKNDIKTNQIIIYW